MDIRENIAISHLNFENFSK